jgi:biotin carboxyl carrier protein
MTSVLYEVQAEIAGSVWKVDVEPGQAVEPGDRLAVLETMKMEIPCVAAERGVVQSVHVVTGQFIAEGDVVAVIAG